ncbi:hypothetical protein QUF99_02850 [Bacillus sp. DX4.1]|uniref:hypothetical protein n=1 Tax=Bacillus sp. DX4.1 TaxID=3055867 RepID=UPI0025A2758D|nr:hypothetical protein [Bacillus sp. DX4.1]MDM5186385.1 hypothetical protein [Bacillus sp. DX4.1]
MYKKRTLSLKISQANGFLLYSEKNSVKPGTIRIRQHEINKLLPYFSLLKLKDIRMI